MGRPSALIYDPVFLLHDAGPMHPESPGRCEAVIRGIQSTVPDSAYTVLRPRRALDEEILLVHTQAYLDLVKQEIQAGYTSLSTGDTNISVHSLESALHAAGAVCVAADFVMENNGRAFCAVRPPGHHASADRGMGFCVFNNAAIGARYAQKKWSLNRILIADFDLHHGNGTQDIFYEDPSVFFFSTHQWPCFPGTGRRSEKGAGKGIGCTLNRPFPPGSGAAEIVEAFENDLVQAMDQFRPELVVISAGFDGRVGDPVGNFQLKDADFRRLTAILCRISRRYSSGRIVSVLEGGYGLAGIQNAAAQHFMELAAE